MSSSVAASTASRMPPVYRVPQLEKLEHFLCVKGAAVKTLARFRYKVTLHAESVEGFAKWRAADAELFRQGAFIDPLFGFELIRSGHFAQLLEKSSGVAFLISGG